VDRLPTVHSPCIGDRTTGISCMYCHRIVPAGTEEDHVAVLVKVVLTPTEKPAVAGENAPMSMNQFLQAGWMYKVR